MQSKQCATLVVRKRPTALGRRELMDSLGPQKPPQAPQERQKTSPSRPVRRKRGTTRPAPARSDEWESENTYRIADRQFHATLAAFTFGFSPISLLKAWQDWILHLAIAPGKQQEIAAKGLEVLAH